MKIGILTYNRTLNYGACLQAVATRIVLENIGHEVYYVDYWPKYHQGKYKVFSWVVYTSLPWKQKIKYLWESVKYRKYTIRRVNNFSVFHNKYIIPYCKPMSETYDIVVYGSDQIWRKQKETQSYNPVYFGKNNIKAQKHISYAASMGELPEKEDEKNLILNLVSNVNKVSVRENDLRNFLYDLGVKDVTLVLDPTLLLSAKDWNYIISTSIYKGLKYVLVYGIGKACFDMNEVEKYARERNCIVKILDSNGIANDTETHITTAAPDVFLNLVKNSECIFTSSFHGLAFSILYQKEFYASFISKKVSRAQTLLTSLGLKDRLLLPNSEIPECKLINYKKVNTLLQDLRKESMQYLIKNIK